MKDDPSGDPGRVPMPALLLGAAGLLPSVLALFVRLAAGVEPATSLPATVASFAFLFTALILTFLGGIWWGVGVSRVESDAVAPWLAVSALPSIAALLLIALMFARPVPAAVLLGVAIIATLLVDRRLAARGLVPPWWMPFRLSFSLALGVLTIGLGLSLA